MPKVGKLYLGRKKMQLERGLEDNNNVYFITMKVNVLVFILLFKKTLFIVFCIYVLERTLKKISNREKE